MWFKFKIYRWEYITRPHNKKNYSILRPCEVEIEIEIEAEMF